MSQESLYTTHEAARMLQADQSTVAKWIDRGVLLAFRTPGGHRRIRASDLRAFIQTYNYPMPAELGGSPNPADWPVGMEVIVRRDNGTEERRTVKYSPWKLGDGSWVIGLDGIAGGYAFERVRKP